MAPAHHFHSSSHSSFNVGFNASVGRRRALQLAALAGAAVAGGGLGGCSRQEPAGRLLSVRGVLPAAWLQELPSDWRADPLASPEAVLAAALRPHETSAQLLALGDGWAQRLDRSQLQPFAAPALLAQLDARAQSASRLFASPGAAALAYPWAFGTWLLLLRSRSDLWQRREQGWDLLLDPSLRGRLVLPSSPRVVIDLACRQLGLPGGTAAAVADPRLPDQLRRLVGQAVALDEVDGLNLLLAGDAEAAVLPSHRVIPLLQSDPRLQALLPASGSPLWWQLLLRPAPMSALAADPPLPLAWLRQGLELPLLDRLLAGGWVPPLPRARLKPALARWPERLRALLLPPEAVLQRCSNLEAFGPSEQQRWQQLWDRALAQ